MSYLLWFDFAYKIIEFRVVAIDKYDDAIQSMFFMILCTEHFQKNQNVG